MEKNSEKTLLKISFTIFNYNCNKELKIGVQTLNKDRDIPARGKPGPIKIYIFIRIL